MTLMKPVPNMKFRNMNIWIFLLFILKEHGKFGFMYIKFSPGG